jgi:hypothetical protein
MAGRPTLYDQAHCAKVIELGKNGASIVEMAHEIGVVKQTLYDWERAHPEFMDALTRARDASQVWWERKGRENLNSSGFAQAMWSRSMAARFPEDWREVSRKELTGKDGEPIKTQELNDDAAAFRRRLLSGASEGQAGEGDSQP